MENRQLAKRHFCIARSLRRGLQVARLRLAPGSPDRASARSLVAQRGITLLEIMIVLAIIGLVMGVLIGPRVFRMFAEAKEDIARIHMTDLANNAYGMWQRDFPDSACPEKLEDLIKYANKKDIKDPWGTAYEMKCSEGLPEGTSFGVVSAGPDRKPNTPDDIRSWESKAQQQKK